MKGILSVKTFVGSVLFFLGFSAASFADNADYSATGLYWGIGADTRVNFENKTTYGGSSLFIEARLKAGNENKYIVDGFNFNVGVAWLDSGDSITFYNPQQLNGLGVKGGVQIDFNSWLDPFSTFLYPYVGLDGFGSIANESSQQLPAGQSPSYALLVGLLPDYGLLFDFGHFYVRISVNQMYLTNLKTSGSFVTGLQLSVTPLVISDDDLRHPGGF